MIKENYITQLAEEGLEGTKHFIVKLTVSSTNLINLFIDGEEGVTIADCVALSRHIEHQLDREAEDFELRVSSAGIDEPFVDIRQYKKNIEKAIEILLEDGSKKRGILKSVDTEQLELAEEVKKENKKSKKMLTGACITIPLQSVKQAKGIIIF